MPGDFPRGFDAGLKARQLGWVLQGVARGDQPPHPVELEPPQRFVADRAMGLMRRIERAAEEPDAHAGRCLRRPRALFVLRLFFAAAQRRVWPCPRTAYLKIVSCSTPTGPRAWKRPVAMPISPPMPNSPPSANWVEALCSTIALLTRARNSSAALRSSVAMASV